MPEETISPAARDSIRTFCRKITVTYDLDEEIQEELYGHIEDKMLGYLSGEEKLTEDDAFVLVCEHFGDSETVKVLLHEVHVQKPENTFVMRAVLHSLYTLAIGLFAAWFASDCFIHYITKSASTSGLNVARFELTSFRFHITLIIGIVMMLPYGLYHVLLSVFPGMFKIEIKKYLLTAFGTLLSFISGVLITVFIILPYTFTYIHPFDMDESISFISLGLFTVKMIKIPIFFGLLFELPLLLSYIAHKSIMNYTWLSKYHRHGIVAIFLISAIMTPPDPLSQIMMALPLIVLFEISILAARLAGRKTVAGIV